MILHKLETNIYQLKNIKVFFISSFSKKQIVKIVDYIFKNNQIKKNQISTKLINQWLKFATNKHAHPLIKKKKVNFKYAVKIKDSPLIIKIFANQSSKIYKNYIIYLKNDFNKYFKIINQNTKIIFSKSENPYIK